MNARTLTTATLFTAFAGILTARAADSQLLSLVMPDARVLAGVNVDSAKGSPFGMYLLTQVQSNSTALQQLITLTGFDPTRDVNEVLAASDATPGSKTPAGLVLARGTFNAAAITAAATAKGAVTEVYNNVTIIEDPKQMAGIAFLSPTLVVGGDVASVKGAIDRPGTGQSLPSAVLTQVNQWSGNQDAWIVTTVPLSGLMPTGAASGTSSGTATSPMAGVMQQIQQIAGGVKFGNSVMGTAAITADNAADATQLANTVQFLVNLAQMQSQSQTNSQMANLAQAVQVSAQGTIVNISVTLPAAQFQQLFQMEKKAAASATPHVGVKK
jgi:hypothetical protein